MPLQVVVADSEAVDLNQDLAADSGPDLEGDRVVLPILTALQLLEPSVARKDLELLIHTDHLLEELLGEVLVMARS